MAVQSPENISGTAAAFAASSFQKSMQEGKIETPAQVFPEDEKFIPEHMLLWARYIYGLYSSGLTVVGPDGYYAQNERPISVLRAYGRGMQPSAKYREILDIRLTQDAPNFAGIPGADNQKSLLNISWQNVRFYPAFRERMIDRLLKLTYKPNVTAIDSLAVEKKQNNYLRDKLASTPQAKEFFAQAGMMPSNITENAEAFGPDEIDVLNALGGYSLAAEMELTEAVRNSFELSRFDPELKRMICEDLVDLGVGAAHTFHDPGSGRQLHEYVDPARLIWRTSAYADCRDSDFAAFIQDKTIAGIRAESGFDEKTLLDIAKTYKAFGGNGVFRFPDMATTIGNREMFANRYRRGGAYDNSKIQVMTFYVVGLDVERYVLGIGARGGRIFDRVKRDSTLLPHHVEAGKRVEDYPVQYVYKCQWIVGTNYVYGASRDVVTVREGTPGAMRALLPVSIYAINGPSVTDSAVSLIDDLQIAILRKRSIMAKMPAPPNIAIDVSRIEDAIQLGTMNVDISDLLEIYSMRGYFLYASRGEFDPANVNNGSPIQELPNTTLQFMQTVQADIESSLQALRMVTGTNELADGSAQPANVLNGVAQNFEASSNRSLSSLYTAVTSLYRQLCIQTARRYQQICSVKDIEIAKVLPGTSLVRSIRLLPEYSVHDYDVSITLTADENMKQQVMNSLMQNRQNAMINEADYLFVAQLVYQDRIEMAQFYLAKAIQRKKMEDAQAQQQAMITQSQAQAQAAASTEQVKMQGQLAQSEAKGKLIILQGKVDDENAAKNHERAKELLILQAKLTEQEEEKEEEEGEPTQKVESYA